MLGFHGDPRGLYSSSSYVEGGTIPRRYCNLLRGDCHALEFQILRGFDGDLRGLPCMSSYVEDIIQYLRGIVISMALQGTYAVFPVCLPTWKAAIPTRCCDLLRGGLTDVTSTGSYRKILRGFSI